MNNHLFPEEHSVYDIAFLATEVACLPHPQHQHPQELNMADVPGLQSKSTANTDTRGFTEMKEQRVREVKVQEVKEPVTRGGPSEAISIGDVGVATLASQHLTMWSTPPSRLGTISRRTEQRG